MRNEGLLLSTLDATESKSESPTPPPPSFEDLFSGSARQNLSRQVGIRQKKNEKEKATHVSANLDDKPASPRTKRILERLPEKG